SDYASVFVTDGSSSERHVSIDVPRLRQRVPEHVRGQADGFTGQQSLRRGEHHQQLGEVAAVVAAHHGRYIVRSADGVGVRHVVGLDDRYAQSLEDRYALDLVAFGGQVV